jgi:hypothetical protein
MIRALVDSATTERVIVIPSRPSLRILHLSSLCFLFFRDYYAALLRTHQSFVAPTQGTLLNYVQRVALGVVAQITVRPTSRRRAYYLGNMAAFLIYYSN